MNIYISPFLVLWVSYNEYPYTYIFVHVYEYYYRLSSVSPIVKLNGIYIYIFYILSGCFLKGYTIFTYNNSTHVPISLTTNSGYHMLFLPIHWAKYISFLFEFMFHWLHLRLNFFSYYFISLPICQWDCFSLINL